MKILLIDDDLSLSAIFETALKKEGFDIVTAADGRSGLDKAKVEKPNLILLDQVLPDIQGNEILKTLKEDSETKAIPLAMLSNFGQDDLIKTAIDSGAMDYILKYQIEPQDLVNKVKSLLQEAQTSAPSA